ncbi:hypothetical protein A2K36_004729, partial [Escherichia coli]|nr:hypothetical protein [Escherichia coli]
IKVQGKILPKANLTCWISVSETYLRAKKIEQLGYLFDKYHEQLFNIISNKKWYVRVHNYLAPSLSPIEMDEEKVKKITIQKSQEISVKVFPL